MKFVVYRCATFVLVVRVLQEVVVIRLLTNKTLQWQRCVAMFEREEVMAQAGETAQELAAIALSKVKELTQCGGDKELLISTKLMELAEKNQDDPIFHNDEKLIEWAWPKLVQISDGTPSSHLSDI